MTKRMTSEDNVVAAVSSTMLIEGELRNQSLHKGRRNEHPEKDPKNDAEINAGDLVHPFQHRSVISLMDRVLTWDNVKNLDPDVRLTRGYYYLVYRPKTSARYKKGRPFCIGQDMVRWNLMLAGTECGKPSANRCQNLLGSIGTHILTLFYLILLECIQELHSRFV